MMKDTKFPGLKREILFPTPIYIKELQKTEELNKKLLKDIKAWKKEDPEGIEKTHIKNDHSSPLIYSNINAWRSSTDVRPAFQPLINQLYIMVDHIFKDLGYQPKVELSTIWTNINYPGGFNTHHTHANSTMSGVYYVRVPVDDPECCIWVEDPRPGPNLIAPRIVHNLPRELWRVVPYPPKEGMAIFFPSWVAHGAGINKSKLKGEKGWRISVAFNFTQANWV